ncbi:MAG: hypothetical protein FD170_3782 [Bacteroidetes bacterium]|nr:MAG: hypothetical protein FD170_3782 [Bacteroidota bacterium]
MAVCLKAMKSHYTNKYTVGQNLIPIESKLQTAKSTRGKINKIPKTIQK